VLDYNELKNAVYSSGLKQKAISEKSGLSETALCLILQGKRKCEIGEYANICSVLNMPMAQFLRPKKLNVEKSQGEVKDNKH